MKTALFPLTIFSIFILFISPAFGLVLTPARLVVSGNNEVVANITLTNNEQQTLNITIEFEYPDNFTVYCPKCGYIYDSTMNGECPHCHSKLRFAKPLTNLSRITLPFSNFTLHPNQTKIIPIKINLTNIKDVSECMICFKAKAKESNIVVRLASRLVIVPQTSKTKINPLWYIILAVVCISCIVWLKWKK